jgi:putative FmdB family regulatory protein
MPTYDYVCDACEHKFDAFESIKSEPQKKCPECGKRKLRRLFGTGAGIIFKGSGFYQTDYRSEGYKKAAEADKKSAEPAVKESSGDQKKVSKSETTTPVEPKSKLAASESTSPKKRRAKRND